jgi:hypothetical protein
MRSTWGIESHLCRKNLFFQRASLLRFCVLTRTEEAAERNRGGLLLDRERSLPIGDVRAEVSVPASAIVCRRHGIRGSGQSFHPGTNSSP